jgi:transcriptional regulator with XRE-family HTH domain
MVRLVSQSQAARMPKKTSKQAANHLRAWREFRRMTQEQLAESVGTAGNVIGLLESGERGLSHKWLLKLAPALGTTPGFLLDHSPYDLDTSFLDAALSVPPENRAQALAILQTFKKRA